MIAATLALTGCTVPVKGITGITVDDQGNLAAVFAWCGDNAPDGATLYVPGGIFDNGHVARYQAPRLTGHFASVHLDTPTRNWVMSPPAPVLHPGTTYDIYGWTSSDTASTAHVEFHLADRDRLAPGTVLIQTGDAVKGETDALVSAIDFQQRGQAFC